MIIAVVVEIFLYINELNSHSHHPIHQPGRGYFTSSQIRNIQEFNGDLMVT